jgi:hypothetical protein
MTTVRDGTLARSSNGQDLTVCPTWNSQRF